MKQKRKKNIHYCQAITWNIEYGYLGVFYWLLRTDVCWLLLVDFGENDVWAGRAKTNFKWKLMLNELKWDQSVKKN